VREGLDEDPQPGEEGEVEGVISIGPGLQDMVKRRRGFVFKPSSKYSWR